MKTINGLKITELSDIVRESGGKPEVCKELLYHAHDVLSLFKNDELITLDTWTGGNLSVNHLDQPYQFSLVSKALLEEKIIVHAVVKALEDNSEFIQSEAQKGKVRRIIEQHNDHYDLMAEEHTIEEKYQSPCYAFAAISDRVIDVFTTTPETLVSVVSRPVVYQLEDDAPAFYGVDPTSDETFVPPIFYKEVRGKILYYKEPVKGSRPVGQ